VLIMVSGMTIPKSLEERPAELINMTFMQRTKQNFRGIKEAFKIRELYRSVLFFCLFGCVVPSFSDFLYYY